jgi:hypothetical protein
LTICKRSACDVLPELMTWPAPSFCARDARGHAGKELPRRGEKRNRKRQSPKVLSNLFVCIVPPKLRLRNRLGAVCPFT